MDILTFPQQTEDHHQKTRNDFHFYVKNFELDMKLKQLQVDKNDCLSLLPLLLENQLLILLMISHAFQLPSITSTSWLMIFMAAGKIPLVIILRTVFENCARILLALQKSIDWLNFGTIFKQLKVQCPSKRSFWNHIGHKLCRQLLGRWRTST